MDKIQRKNVNLRNTLLALYNLPQEARIRTVYQAMGIDIDREENSRCMVAWAVRGVVPDAVAAALQYAAEHHLTAHPVSQGETS